MVGVLRTSRSRPAVEKALPGTTGTVGRSGHSGFVRPSCFGSPSVANAANRACGCWPRESTTWYRTVGPGRCSSTRTTTRACVSDATIARRRWRWPRGDQNRVVFNRLETSDRRQPWAPMRLSAPGRTRGRGFLADPPPRVKKFRPAAQKTAGIPPCGKFSPRQKSAGGGSACQGNDSPRP